MNQHIAATAIGAALLTVVGCSGDLPPSCDGPMSPGPSPIRRLTKVEYNNTVFQLLGDTTFPATKFAPDEEANGFDNQATALVVSPLLAEQHTESAEALAARHADKYLADMSGCGGAAGAIDQAACARDVEAFIRSFGKRAFRRPLSDDEVQVHADLFTTGTTLGSGSYDPRAGIEVVLQAMLQSPYFLYRVEFGSTDAEAGDVVQLTSYEMASRLSYLFWNTMPDTALFEAAERDELRSKAQIEAQARRMLAAPRARDAMRNFHRQWLGLDEIPNILSAGKDRAIYPDYRESIIPLLQQESEFFLDYAIFEEDAGLETLFTAPFSMMNEDLAEFYGLENGPRGDEFVRVNLDPAKHAGIITQAGLLALHATAYGSSPVHRGKFVRQQLFCQIPPPPPDVVPEPPSVDLTKTTREQYFQHQEDPGCSECHKFMDLIGFGFEHYGGLGRYRDTQGNDLPIDATGTIVPIDPEESKDESKHIHFDGVIELSEILATSDDVRDCVSTQWFRFAYGRAETESDTCSMDVIRAGFAASNYDVKELLVAITQTDAFRYRKRATNAVEDNP